MNPLSQAVEERVIRLFDGNPRDEARRLLETECGESVPGWRLAGLDRLRIAALKFSGGELDGLRGAIALAHTDVRDLLMAAGFGEDVDAHAEWWPDD